MKLINGWNFIQKDNNRLLIEFRISLLTLFRLYVDLSARQAHLTVFNIRLEVG